MFGSQNFLEPIGSYFLSSKILQEPRNRTEKRMSILCDKLSYIFTRGEVASCTLLSVFPLPVRAIVLWRIQVCVVMWVYVHLIPNALFCIYELMALKLF